LTLARIDFKPATRQPAILPVVLATLVALGASLGADRLLVAAGTSVFPSTTGYVHFRFGDYAELTVIGVIVACLAWPVTTRLTTQPRWLFFRLAIVVTIVLLAPDAWLLLRQQPTRAVAVLVAMHLAIALITYNVLVHAAPAGSATPPDQSVAPTPASTTTEARAATPVPATAPVPAARTEPRTTVPVPGASVDPAGQAPGERRPSRAPWLAMFGLIMVESVVGVWALIVVPNNRPDAALPTDGRAVYLVHAVIGAALGIGALVLILTRGRTNRLSFNCALVGLIGTAVAGAGGSLTTYKSDRLLGAALMLVGAVVAAFAYLTPATEPAERKPPGMATNYNAAPWPGQDGP
jgi:hypothetical protein